jgi:hypothetical protein
MSTYGARTKELFRKYGRVAVGVHFAVYGAGLASEFFLLLLRDANGHDPLIIIFFLVARPRCGEVDLSIRASMQTRCQPSKLLGRVGVAG